MKASRLGLSTGFVFLLLMPSLLTVGWFRRSNPQSRTPVRITLDSGQTPSIPPLAPRMQARIDRLDQDVFVCESHSLTDHDALMTTPPFDDSFWNGPPLHRATFHGTLTEWLDASILDEGWQNLVAAFPAFGKAGIAERWAGLIDTSPDATPIMSEAGQVPGLFIATGFSGHGFGLGPAAGRLMAELVTGANPCVDPTPFRFDRFTKMKRAA